MITDLEYGAGMDTVIKMQADYMPNYVYEFKYKSWHDWVPKFMGKLWKMLKPDFNECSLFWFL